VTPGRTAPLESLTLPPMLPYTAWAAHGAGKTVAVNPQRIVKSIPALDVRARTFLRPIKPPIRQRNSLLGHSR
jgi:hypothetical protein